MVTALNAQQVEEAVGNLACGATVVAYSMKLFRQQGSAILICKLISSRQDGEKAIETLKIGTELEISLEVAHNSIRCPLIFVQIRLK